MKKMPINSLILLAIDSAKKDDKKCTFEQLIKECFTLFPETFAFSQKTQWPDARKLDRPLRTLRNKKLINGSPQTCFSLTKTGKKIVEETTKLLRQKKLEFSPKYEKS